MTLLLLDIYRYKYIIGLYLAKLVLIVDSYSNVHWLVTQLVILPQFGLVYSNAVTGTTFIVYGRQDARMTASWRNEQRVLIVIKGKDVGWRRQSQLHSCIEHNGTAGRVQHTGLTTLGYLYYYFIIMTSTANGNSVHKRTNLHCYILSLKNTAM